MFHRLLPDHQIARPNAYSERGTLISIAFFERILQKISDVGYRVVTLQQYIHLLKAHKDCSRLIVLTFDDGYRDNYTYALPLLRKFGYLATFFPILKYCIEANAAPLDYYYHTLDALNYKEVKRQDYISGTAKKQFLSLHPTEQLAFVKREFGKMTVFHLDKLYMNTTQLNKLAAEGHEIGCHTWQHPIMPQLSAHEIDDEIKQFSIALHALNIPMPSTFAYPDGAYNEEIIHILKEKGFQGACTVHHPHTFSNKSLFELPRYFVTPNWSLDNL